nr:putative L-ascorbate peroxidase [Tanacetum cinerariifolium]
TAHLRISLNATVPGLNLCGFFTPPVAGADFQAAFVASCLRGAFPPVDLRAVCLGLYKGDDIGANFGVELEVVKELLEEEMLVIWVMSSSGCRGDLWWLIMEEEDD